MSELYIDNKNVGNSFVGRVEVVEDKLQSSVGNWVSGETFWGRKKELALFLKEIQNGENLLLTAPRRIGKTSLMREAIQQLGDSTTCLFVDLENCKSAEDAIANIAVQVANYRSLWDKAKGVFSIPFKAIESIGHPDFQIKLRGDLNVGNWQAKGDGLFEVLAKTGKRVVLFLDEVPILVNRLLVSGDGSISDEGRQKADLFVSWLRATALRHKGKVQQVITGSIGLAPVLKRANLSATINHLSTFDLGPWSDEEACAALLALAKWDNIDLEESVARHMLEKLGMNIPHHVQLFYKNINRDLHLGKINLLDREAVEKVYMESMLGVSAHADLSHMEERLRTVLSGDKVVFTFELLTEAAVAGELTADALEVLAKDYEFPKKELRNLFAELLHVLEHDGYLKRNSKGNFEFRSNLIRDWWKARHSFGYSKVAERNA